QAFTYTLLFRLRQVVAVSNRYDDHVCRISVGSRMTVTLGRRKDGHVNAGDSEDALVIGKGI
ncbi:MAG: hypothetical protein CME24_00005, partial [Gemmatimonadetes bacterium]|nr:hypothetical protein [Gemmatimonadota bacterium]